MGWSRCGTILYYRRCSHHPHVESFHWGQLRRKRPRLQQRRLHYEISSRRRTHLIFGANTDVGKTIVSAGLVQASLNNNHAISGSLNTATSTHYIKPLQCGGSDQAFVERYANGRNEHVDSMQRHFSARTLFQWDTPVSPHSASMLENKPCSDEQILAALQASFDEIFTRATDTDDADRTGSRNDDSLGVVTTYVETAGGVLSPAAASPENTQPRHVQTQQSVERSSSSSSQWGWTLQADLYQPLIGFAPVVLVGDGRLGGISCTLTALESLILRGYDVAAIIVLDSNNDSDNALASNQHSSKPDTVSALRDYVSRRGFSLRSGAGDELFPHPTRSIVSLPSIPSDTAIPLYEWYTSEIVSNTFAQLNQYLQQCWEGQVADLTSLARSSDAQSVVWWPDSMDLPTQGRVLVDSAVGGQMQIVQCIDSTSSTPGRLRGCAVVDAAASSWTRGVGHGESSLALAAAAAAGRYGHVSGAIRHAPAETLARNLIAAVGGSSSWAKRVFYADDGSGSAAVEAAIQMGLQTYQKRMKLTVEEFESTNWILCTQEDCYHGDTLGAKVVAEDYVDRTHPWYQAKSLCLATPTLGYQNGVLSISFPDGMQPSDDVNSTFPSTQHVMDVVARSVSPKLFSLYKEFIEMQWLVHEHRHQQKIGSVLLEPILQCAGGMKFVDPLWQCALMEQAESRNIPVIFDESTVGLYRLGVTSCRSILKRDPDIAIYTKLLTSGLVPLSATLTTNEVWDALACAVDNGESTQHQRLLHGNTSVANPVACVAALHALAAYDSSLRSRMNVHNTMSSSSNWSSLVVPQLWFDESYSKELSELPCVKQSFTLGTVLSVTLNETTEELGFGSKQVDDILGALWSHDVKAHALGNVIYIMATPLTDREECNRMAGLLYESIRKLKI